MSMFVYVYICVCVYVSVYLRMYACIRACVCMYVRMYVRMYVCMIPLFQVTQTGIDRLGGARCSSVLNASAHGAVEFRIDPSLWTQ